MKMKIPSYVPLYVFLEIVENILRRVWRYHRTDNTMAKRKSTKGQKTIYKTYI